MAFRFVHGLSAHQHHAKWCRLFFATPVCSASTSASRYGFSAELGRFLQPRFPWKQWAVEDSSMSLAWAGLDVEWALFPVEIRRAMRSHGR